MLLSRKSDIRKRLNNAVFYSALSLLLFVLLLLPGVASIGLLLPALIVALCLALYNWLDAQRVSELMDTLNQSKRFREHNRRMMNGSHS